MKLYSKVQQYYKVQQQQYFLIIQASSWVTVVRDVQYSLFCLVFIIFFSIHHFLQYSLFSLVFSIFYSIHYFPQYSSSSLVCIIFPSIHHTSSGACMGPKGHRAIGSKGPQDQRAIGSQGPQGPKGHCAQRGGRLKLFSSNNLGTFWVSKGGTAGWLQLGV